MATTESSRRNAKFEHIPKLSGQSNYLIWSNACEIAFHACKWWGIVNGTIAQPEDPEETGTSKASASATTAPITPDEWYDINFQALHALNTSVDPSILPNIVQLRSAPEAWTTLKNLYDRETNNTTITLLKTIVDRKLIEGASMSEHLSGFNNDWNRLLNRAIAAKGQLGRSLRTLAECNHSKAGFLLISLPESMNNIIDNLQTKGDLTFEDVHSRLLDLSANHSSGSGREKAYRVEKSGSGGKGPKECTWCAKRGHYAKGHTWQECNKLKASKKNESDKSANLHGEKARMASQPSEDSSTMATAFMVSANLTPSTASSVWIFDTGATSHMTPDTGVFSGSLRPHSGHVKFANGERGAISGIGTVKLRCRLPGGRMGLAVLHDVLKVDSLKTNLFSWKAVAKKGFRLSGNGSDIWVRDTEGKDVLWARETLGNHVLQLVEESAHFTYEEWHQALGHPSVSSINAAKSYIDQHLIPTPPKNFHCDVCSLSKSVHHRPAESSGNNKATCAFELIHTDLSGKFSVPSIGKRNYYITFIDDYTRYAAIVFLTKKSDATSAIKTFVKQIEKQHDTTIKRFRHDNGGEYINEELQSYYESSGIVYELTPPYGHESNGLAERFNRTIITMMRAMMMDIDSKFLWAEAAATAVYIRNRLPHSRLPDQTTPYEALHGKKPSIKHLQPFGRRCFMHIPEETRPPGSKLLARSMEGKFVGYTKSNKIYRIWLPSRPTQIRESRDVQFPPIPPKTVQFNLTIREPAPEPETQPPPKSDPSTPTQSNFDDMDLQRLIQQSPRSPTPPPRPESPVIPGSFVEPEPRPLRRSQRERRAPDRYGYISTVLPNEPKTYHQAIKGIDADLWKMAMEEEMESLRKNDTWEEVDQPARKIVDSKWVFKVKLKADGTVERYKARVVGKGFSQQPGVDYDETYAPVARYDSFRLLTAIAAWHGWIPQQMDVKSAFLYGILKETIYMRLPEGYQTPGKVAKLRKCIYGLKQSAREWYACLTALLRELGFVETNFDPCVFVHQPESTFLSIYVDDTTIFGPKTQFLADVKRQLGQRFDCKDLGDARFILGLELKYTANGISISQQSYIERILERFGMSDSRPVATPLDPNMPLRKSEPGTELADISEYQRIIGSLMYAVTGTRPDLAHTVTLLSQFSSAPNQVHLQAAKRVLRYLRGTTDWDLHYPRGPESTPLGLTCYSDSSYASNLDDRRSFSGYVARLGEASISWASKKQKSVAVSTTEAEYMAMSTASRHLTWLQRAMAELKQTTIPGTVATKNHDIDYLLGDNQGALELARNHRISERTKHIDVHYHHVREQLHAGSYGLRYVPTEDNLADLLTKILPKPRHHEIAEKIRCVERGEVSK